MSWYVRKLLLSREVIHSNLEQIYENDRRCETEDSFPYLEESTYLMYDLDSDTYSDLISVEMCIKSLLNMNQFSKLERIILNDLLLGLRPSEIETKEKISWNTVVKKMIDISNRIAYNLGYHFTDNGYLEYLIEKYELNFEQIKKIEKIIKEET